MTFDALYEQISLKKSFLCTGLDTDIDKIPPFLLKDPDPLFTFNKKIIKATQDLTVAYKLNIAFYEALGPAGWELLGKTLDIIPKDIFTIADAKRSDIGNTAKKYAATFFDRYNFDAVTVNPYMGKDSIIPFLEYKNKWTIILALTSNPGSNDFQFMKQEDEMLFERVVRLSNEWGGYQNIMFVAGATQGKQLKKIREIAPQNFLLVPGVGAQGGDLQTVAKAALNNKCGLLINSSRSIIYAGKDKNFANDSKEMAGNLQKEMEQILITAGIS